MAIEQKDEDLKKIKTEDEIYSDLLITEFDTSLFAAGKHLRLYQKLGAHPGLKNGVQGCYFSVWAPNANYLSLTGDFNGWNKESHPMLPRWDHSGIWEIFVPELSNG